MRPVGMGRVKLVTIDLKPLPANDSRGLSSSALQFGLLVAELRLRDPALHLRPMDLLAQRLLAIGRFVAWHRACGGADRGPVDRGVQRALLGASWPSALSSPPRRC